MNSYGWKVDHSTVELVRIEKGFRLFNYANLLASLHQNVLKDALQMIASCCSALCCFALLSLLLGAQSRSYFNLVSLLLYCLKSEEREVINIRVCV